MGAWWRAGACRMACGLFKGETMNDYNEKNCDERHKNIREELDNVWGKLKSFEGRIWAIVILQIMVLGGIIGVLLK